MGLPVNRYFIQRVLDPERLFNRKKISHIDSSLVLVWNDYRPIFYLVGSITYILVN